MDNKKQTITHTTVSTRTRVGISLAVTGVIFAAAAFGTFRISAPSVNNTTNDIEKNPLIGSLIESPYEAEREGSDFGWFDYVVDDGQGEVGTGTYREENGSAIPNEPAMDVSLYVDIAVDVYDVAHYIYEYDNAALMYATMNTRTGEETYQLIEVHDITSRPRYSSGDLLLQSGTASIAVDKEGRAHIAYATYQKDSSSDAKTLNLHYHHFGKAVQRSTKETILTDSKHNSVQTDIAINTDGEAVIPYVIEYQDSSYVSVGFADVALGQLGSGDPLASMTLEEYEKLAQLQSAGIDSFSNLSFEIAEDGAKHLYMDVSANHVGMEYYSVQRDGVWSTSLDSGSFEETVVSSDYLGGVTLSLQDGGSDVYFLSAGGTGRLRASEQVGTVEVVDGTKIVQDYYHENGRDFTGCSGFRRVRSNKVAAFGGLTVYRGCAADGDLTRGGPTEIPDEDYYVATILYDWEADTVHKNRDLDYGIIGHEVMYATLHGEMRTAVTSDDRLVSVGIFSANDEYEKPHVVLSVSNSLSTIMPPQSIGNSVTEASYVSPVQAFGFNSGLVYYNAWTEGVHFAFRDSTDNWLDTIVDDDGSVGTYLSAAEGENGSIHLAYYRETHDHGGVAQDLMYANNATGSWQTTAVDLTNDVGTYAEIAVDGDRVHIAYTDATTGDLKYATASGTSANRTSGWAIETIDSTVVTGAFTHNSIAVDEDGVIHVATVNPSGYVVHFEGTTGAWTREFVTPGSANAAYTSIDVRSNVAISYYRGRGNDLMVAERNEGAWNVTLVDESGDVGMDSSIARDSNGVLHVGYYDATNEQVKYAHNAADDWYAMDIYAGDSPGSVGMIIDEWDGLHFAFPDTSDKPQYRWLP